MRQWRTTSVGGAACAALIASLIAAGGSPLGAQAAPRPAAQGDSLYRTVAALDSALFDAYNRCDLARLGSLVSEDLEFYHDKTGLERGRAPFVESIRKYVCGKARRDIVPGTLEVHSLAGYGAFEMGEHLFCDPQRFRACPDAESGIAKFMMLWRLQDGAWQITRVVSYDHLNSHERPKRAAAKTGGGSR